MSNAGEMIGFCLVLDERFNERTINDDDAMGA
jgi:hypothetical protein